MPVILVDTDTNITALVFRVIKNIGLPIWTHIGFADMDTSVLPIWTHISFADMDTYPFCQYGHISVLPIWTNIGRYRYAKPSRGVNLVLLGKHLAGISPFYYHVSYQLLLYYMYPLSLANYLFTWQKKIMDNLHVYIMDSTCLHMNEQ